MVINAGEYCEADLVKEVSSCKSLNIGIRSIPAVRFHSKICVSVTARYNG